jgi:UPF0271 protein
VRAVREGLVRSVGGKDIRVAAETICVHSDTPGAGEVARILHEILRAEGILPAPAH